MLGQGGQGKRERTLFSGCSARINWLLELLLYQMSSHSLVPPTPPQNPASHCVAPPPTSQSHIGYASVSTEVLQSKKRAYALFGEMAEQEGQRASKEEVGGGGGGGP